MAEQEAEDAVTTLTDVSFRAVSVQRFACGFYCQRGAACVAKCYFRPALGL